MPKRQLYVSIMTNAHHTVLHTGMTNNLQRRVLERKSGKGSGFTQRYNVAELVYVEAETILILRHLHSNTPY